MLVDADKIVFLTTEMRDIALLQNLDQPNEDLSSVWALMPPLSPKPTPPLSTLPESILQDNEKQVKGSRFAKFIAERDKLFRGSTQLGKAGSISNVIFPSKLWHCELDKNEHVRGRLMRSGLVKENAPASRGL